jgi:hypothetical protein
VNVVDPTGERASTRRSLLGAGFSVFLGHVAAAQKLEKPNGKKDDYLRKADVPSYLERYRSALGERLEKAGLERVVSSGTLREKGADKSAVLIWELPGRFRLEKDGKAILGAGAGVTAPSVIGASSEDEDDLIESLFLDRPETAFYNVLAGASVKLLGYQVGLQRGYSKNYAGPYYDVFDIEGRVGGKLNSPVRSKRYVFDSMSGLLQRVTYLGGRSGLTPVATHFGQWTKLQQESVPGVIERRVNNESVARFEAAQNAVGAKQEDGKLDRV